LKNESFVRDQHESKDSSRGIGNSLAKLLFSFERPGDLKDFKSIGTSLTGLRKGRDA
jgi:hypothetical protein